MLEKLFMQNIQMAQKKKKQQQQQHKRKMA